MLSARRFGARLRQAAIRASRTAPFLAARNRTFVAPPRPQPPLTGAKGGPCARLGWPPGDSTRCVGIRRRSWNRTPDHGSNSVAASAPGTPVIDQQCPALVIAPHEGLQMNDDGGHGPGNRGVGGPRHGAPPPYDRFRSPGSVSTDGRVHRSEEHTSELQSPDHLVCRLLLEKKKKRSKKT